MDETDELNDSLLTKAVNTLVKSIQNTFIKLILHQDEPIHLAINQLLELWFQFTRRALQNPDQAINAQILYWNDYLLLCKDLQQRLVHPHDTKKPVILFQFIEKFHFLLSQHVILAIKNSLMEAGKEEAKKIAFYIQKFEEAFSMARFEHEHPDLFRAVLAGKESEESPV